jgi:voltage-gated potassium channel
MTFKHRIYQILEVAEQGDRLSRLFDVFIISLIGLNVLTFILSTVPSLDSLRYEFRVFEIASVIVFTIEYVLRLWSCTVDAKYEPPVRGRLRFARQGMAIIDLLAILPFYLALIVPAARVLDLRVLRSVRLMRIFRLFKLGRYSSAMKTMGKVLRNKKEELGITLFIVLLLLVIASSLMYFVENSAQPEVFSSIPATMWWSVETLTTVGYGDVIPETALGKVLGMVIAILGIGMFALPAGILGSGFFEEVQSKRGQTTVCPHCGKEISRK